MNSVSIATNLASDSDERATLRSLVVSMSCASISCGECSALGCQQ